ncbi:putative (-)-germacrene D synthase [Helianthus annuus]|uniref:(-)-germacrene D synthase n=1 Tax=Helianthus annuus TaxID=4232 RepID=A0A9K3JSJ1_HELAN|nr:putative (-)-germacrene D synthase [Helianthus annuus]KAJ0955916.1 putative (-)-germacrene D synthase [Helianthus annuus]
MEVKQEVVRPLSTFHPSIWEDQFLVYEEGVNESRFYEARARAQLGSSLPI